MKVKTTMQGGSQFRAAMVLLVKQTRAGLKTEVRRAAVGTRSIAKKEAPKASGALKNSIQETYENDGLVGIVAPAAAYSPWVEGVFHNYALGRKPGKRPPFEPILRWVILKSIGKKWRVSDKSAAFLVQRKIGKKGTPAQPFMKPAIETWRPKFLENCKRVFTQAAQQAFRLRRFS